MVKVFEVIDRSNINYDHVDDAGVFMKNDAMFYRKHYFPTFSKVAEMHRAGKKIDPQKMIMPMIEKGLEGYCKKYDLADVPDQIFNGDDRMALLDKLFSEEMDLIEKGEYT